MESANNIFIPASHKTSVTGLTTIFRKINGQIKANHSEYNVNIVIYGPVLVVTAQVIYVNSNITSFNQSDCSHINQGQFHYDGNLLLKSRA